LDQQNVTAQDTVGLYVWKQAL